MTTKMYLRWRIAQFFELWWWRRYLSRKDKEHYLLWKKNYWLSLLQVIKTGGGSSDFPLFERAGLNILDAGCGPAGMYMVLLPNQHIEATDPLLTLYEEKLAHFSKADYPHIQFFDQTIEQLVTPTAFDIIFCMNAINHVADMELGLERLRALCKPHGWLVLTIDAHKTGFFKSLFRLIPGDVLHPHQYDLGEYVRLLQQKGFREVFTHRIKKGRLFDHYLLVCKAVPL